MFDFGGGRLFDSWSLINLHSYISGDHKLIFTYFYAGLTHKPVNYTYIYITQELDKVVFTEDVSPEHFVTVKISCSFLLTEINCTC